MRKSLLILLLAVVAGALLERYALRMFLPLENRVNDFFVRLHAVGHQADTDIVFIDIDDISLKAMNDEAGKWPWPRAVHADLVEGLAKQKPRAIVFDIAFFERDTRNKDSDRRFNEVLAATPGVYFASLRPDKPNDKAGDPLRDSMAAFGLTEAPAGAEEARAELMLPLAIDAPQRRTGLINFLGDRDGVGRRYYLYQEVGGWRLPSLPVRVARDLGFPVPEGRSIVLGWSGDQRPHPFVSYALVWADMVSGKPQRPADEFTGKIVIIGSSASLLSDLRATPIHSLYPGPEILATAIDNLKNGQYLHTARDFWRLLLTTLLLGGLTRVFWLRYSTLLIGAGLLGVSTLLYGLNYLALEWRWLVPVTVPLLFAWLFYFGAALEDYLRERKAREQTVRVFNRFLDPRVVKELVGQGETVQTLSGQSRTLTLLFSDIRGFTTLSETRAPQEIVELLNHYFSRQVEVIFQHNGTLDKFIGDAIMAFWGAPAEDPLQAQHAVAASLDMADALQTFKQELGELGETFDIGIGIHTGPAVVGFLGSKERQDYTAIGDTVNLASRIEGQTKGVARILVSGETREACGDAFDFVDHGSYKVKGRAQEVRLFEPRRKPT